MNSKKIFISPQEKLWLPLIFSCTYLKCTWKFSHKHKPQDTLQCLNTDWIFFKSFTDELIPYSSTDFVFEIFFNGVVQGYHNIFFKWEYYWNNEISSEKYMFQFPYFGYSWNSSHGEWRIYYSNATSTSWIFFNWGKSIFIFIDTFLERKQSYNEENKRGVGDASPTNRSLLGELIKAWYFQWYF